MKTITYNQYMQLVGLITAGRKQVDLVNALEEAACEITGEEKNSGGHTMDMIYGSREVDDALRILKIKVDPRRKKKRS